MEKHIKGKIIIEIANYITKNCIKVNKSKVYIKSRSKTLHAFLTVKYLFKKKSLISDIYAVALK